MGRGSAGTSAKQPIIIGMDRKDKQSRFGAWGFGCVVLGFGVRVLGFGFWGTDVHEKNG